MEVQTLPPLFLAHIIEEAIYFECLCWDGSYRTETLDMDAFIGIEDGQLCWGEHGFSTAVRNVCILNNILQAEVYSSDGTIEHSTLDLSTHMICINGSMHYHGGSFQTYYNLNNYPTPFTWICDKFHMLMKIASSSMVCQDNIVLFIQCWNILRVYVLRTLCLL